MFAAVYATNQSIWHLWSQSLKGPRVGVWEVVATTPLCALGVMTQCVESVCYAVESASAQAFFLVKACFDRAEHFAALTPPLFSTSFVVPIVDMVQSGFKEEKSHWATIALAVALLPLALCLCAALELEALFTKRVCENEASNPSTPRSHESTADDQAPLNVTETSQPFDGSTHTDTQHTSSVLGEGDSALSGGDQTLSPSDLTRSDLSPVPSNQFLTPAARDALMRGGFILSPEQAARASGSPHNHSPVKSSPLSLLGATDDFPTGRARHSTGGLMGMFNKARGKRDPAD